MEITRPYPFKGRVFSVGQVFEFEEPTCQRMESANPPFGKRLETVEEVEQTNGQLALHMFTDAALRLLDEYKLTFEDYDGEGSGSGGKVTKTDVASWLTETEED